MATNDTKWMWMTSPPTYDVIHNSSRDIWWPSLCGNATVRNAFWSHKLTVDSSKPDLTNCFQDTVLIWVPYGFLWISLVFYLPYLLMRKTVHSSWEFSLLNSLKVFIGVLLIGICFLDLIVRLQREEVHVSSKIASFIKLISMTQVTFLLRLEFLKGVHTALVFFIFWLLLAFCNIIRLRSQILQYSDLHREDDKTLYIIYYAFFTLICAQFVFTLFADLSAKAKRHRRTTDEHQPLLSKYSPAEKISGKKEVPEKRVPAWNRVSFLWVLREVIRGYRRPVTFDDLYDLKDEDKCSRLLPAFYELYKETQKTEYQPSITNEEWMSTYSITSRASISIMRQSKSRRWRFPRKFGFFASVFWSAGYESLFGLLLMCLSCGLVLLQPQILKLLINFIPEEHSYIWHGVGLAVALFTVSFVNSIVIQQFTYYCWIAGMKTRTVINSVVYRKAMRLSMTSRKSTTVGEIVNFMSVDAQKVQDAFSYIIILGQVPLLAVASFFFIYNTIGVATFAGVAVLLILLPFNGLFMANITRRLQAKQMLAKDHRLKRMNEILSGIKILKLYAWEPSFIKKLLRHRDKELVSIKYANIFNALSLVTWILCPFFLSLAIFSTYVLLSPDNILTAEKIFVTLSYINTFNYVISFFPVSVGFASQGYVSLKRLSKFMKMEEIQEDYVEKHFLMREAICIEDGSFRWEKNGRIILKNINLQVPRGQLIAVVGQVGAGKSSLISALLGEMTRYSGSVKINGSLAYVPQQAWIQNETLRDNILFGKQLITQRYEDVIYTCALKPDLRMLPGGDMTEIGEKGINLSGGQKQRISLARAVYQNEDIYLLDDPLSAVDAHVGKHIFEKVIGPEGLLRKKTRLLVTHGISFLPRTDVIVVIKDGQISEVGEYQSLLHQNGAFAEFLRNHLLENMESEASDDMKELHRHLSNLSGTESEIDLENPNKIKRRKKLIRTPSETLPSNIPPSRSSRAGSLSGSEIEASKIIEEEAMKIGSVRWSVIGTFIKAAGDRYFIITVLFNLLFTSFNVITNIWLSDWSRDVPVNGSMPQAEVNNRLGVYGSLGAAQTLSVIVMMLASAFGCLSVSKELHIKLLKRVMNAPLSWFDRTPLGRIMNRFSKDLDNIDTNVPFFLRGWLFGVSPILATLVIICYITPLILVIVVPLVFLFFFLQRMYIRYAGQLRRIDAMRRSPIFAHFDESVTGTTSIRAYNRLTQFTSRCNDLIDESQQPYYMSIVALSWLGVTMETLGAFLVFFSALFTVLNKDNLDAGMVGLSVTFALQVVVQLNSLVRCSAEMELHMVSVERIDEYCEIEQEASWRVPNLKLPFDWPTLGHIKFDAYCTRYRSCLDLVLRDINLNILPAEKVGLVGRTGAGKSSLALSLFRIIEAAGGSITIDGFRLDRLGLHDVRSRLTIIPQDPVIFSGTLRDNLDPFEEYADYEIWNALDHTHLTSLVKPLEKGLYYACGESGESLSVGQRQLICLARALLRRSRVLILDEATAAIDLETDALIQQTIRTAFHDCTVLTIAHRIHTVLDYDKIMVLAQGRVVEFDKPSALLDNRRSMFFSLAQEAGLVQ